MTKISAVYLGEKRCELTHGPSGAKIQTDAPADNNGKGELFGPTDLMGASLAACILTVMGIVADRDHIALKGATAEVEKEMKKDPRRVGKLSVVVQMPKGISKEARAKLEATARHCPVHKSLHPEIECPIEFRYPD